MLTDNFPRPSAIHVLLEGAANGPSRLAEGVYLRSGHGGSNYVPGWEEWPEVAHPCGVCDSYEQVLEKVPELHDPDRHFVLYLTCVRKDEQESWGGWRWHKWGEYIGEHEITTEYLYDEPVVEKVYCFHVYEKT